MSEKLLPRALLAGSEAYNGFYVGPRLPPSRKMEDLTKFRQRLVNTILAPQSLLQNALLPHDMEQSSLEGFLASWDEVSHLSARDVLIAT